MILTVDNIHREFDNQTPVRHLIAYVTSSINEIREMIEDEDDEDIIKDDKLLLKDNENLLIYLINLNVFMVGNSEVFYHEKNGKLYDYNGFNLFESKKNTK